MKNISRNIGTKECRSKVNAPALLLFLVSLLILGCTSPSPVSEGEVVWSPDYDGAVIPYNIAPLNFCIDGAENTRVLVEVRGERGSLSVRARHGRVVFPEKKWHRLLENEKGNMLTVSIRRHPETTSNPPSSAGFSFIVSPDPIDPYVTYRIIDPSFEVWHHVEIRERDVTSFRERILSDWRHTDNSCMNCHIHGGSRGDLSFFHLRGAQGGTILNRDGTLRKLTLKNDSMPVAATYGDFHPSGRYAVYTWNNVIPSLRALGSHRMEIYDTASDLLVTDFDTNAMHFSSLTSGTDAYETFPTFSPDGRYIYFCRAGYAPLPDSVRHVRYSLVRVAFDERDATLGDSIEMVWDGPAHGGSASLPKFSPDGRWLMFCRSDYGTFPIWHRETQLMMMDMQTGEVDSLQVLRAKDASSTYHSWSSNGRWVAFASKRDDGMFGRVWFAHVDADGHVSVPFRLPHRDPEHDRLFLRSYNIPDLGNAPVPFDARTVKRLRKNVSAEPFKTIKIDNHNDN